MSAPPPPMNPGSNNEREVQHTKFGLIFVDNELEEGFRKQRYDSRADSIVLTASVMMAVVAGIQPVITFHHKLWSDHPRDIFTKKDEEANGILFAVQAVIQLAGGIAVGVPKVTSRLWQRSPRLSENASCWFTFVLCTGIAFSRQSSIDTWCRPESRLMSVDIDSATVRQPNHCPEYIDPVFFVATMLVLLAPPRTIKCIPLLLLELLIFVVSRTALGTSNHLFEVLVVFFVLLLICAVVFLERLERDQFLLINRVSALARTAEKAHESAKQLVSGLVPLSVLDRLVSGKSVADGGDGTVIFADVQDFTFWCSSKDASEVVGHLNLLYNMIDSAIRDEKRFRHVFKVKTVGDAYWAIVGLPEPFEHHAREGSQFALHIQQQLLVNVDLRELSMRYGVHSGQFVCGVIGTNQFAYEPFGKTNEIAETIEASCPTGSVLISSATLALLMKDDTFVPSVDEGPVVNLSPSGTIKTYQLLRFSTLDEETVVDLDVNVGEDAATNATIDLGLDLLVPVTTRSIHTEAHAKSRFNQKHWLHLRYCNDDLEEKFVKYSGFHFRSTSFVSNVFAFTLLAILLITSLIHDDKLVLVFSASDVAGRVLVCISVLFFAILTIFMDRVPLLLSFSSLYIAAVLVLVAATLMEPGSLMGNEITYLITFFSAFSLSRGVPIVPWLAVFFLNTIFFVIPVHVAMEMRTSMRPFAFFQPVFILPLWWVVCQRREHAARSHFEAQESATDSLAEAKHKIKVLKVILRKTVPPFAVPTLIQCLQGNATGYPYRHYDNISVMFVCAPIVESNRSLRPAELMTIVAKFVKMLDRAVSKFPSVLRVKTMGDRAVVICGACSELHIDTHRPPLMTDSSTASVITHDAELVHSPLIQCCAQACSLVNTEVQRQGPFNVRASAGLHSGPVTCGIIGLERPIYDCFGDTVNVASRLLSVALKRRETCGTSVVASEFFCTAYNLEEGARSGFLVGNPLSTSSSTANASGSQSSTGSSAIDHAMPAPEFLPTEQLEVKGKVGKLTVRQIRFTNIMAEATSLADLTEDEGIPFSPLEP